jgi:hypothetical protein
MERWTGWHRHDTRWRVRVVSTTHLGIDEVVERIASAVRAEQLWAGPSAISEAAQRTDLEGHKQNRLTGAISHPDTHPCEPKLQFLFAA